MRQRKYRPHAVLSGINAWDEADKVDDLDFVSDRVVVVADGPVPIAVDGAEAGGEPGVLAQDAAERSAVLEEPDGIAVPTR